MLDALAAQAPAALPTLVLACLRPPATFLSSLESGRDADVGAVRAALARPAAAALAPAAERAAVAAAAACLPASRQAALCVPA